MVEKSATQSSPNPKAGNKSYRQRPVLSFPQILILTVLIIVISAGLNFNRRAQTGRQLLESEKIFQERVNQEATRKVELQVTRAYVNSEDYVASYARDEGGQILPGERRIVPLFTESVSSPTALPEATPDPAYNARPWQAWWRLFTDAPLPSR